MPRVTHDRLLFLDSRPFPLGWLSEAGTLRDSTGVGARVPRVLGEYCLIFVLSGGGYYRDARGVHAEVREGQALLIFPEIAHSYGPHSVTRQRPEAHWDELYLCFRGPIFDLWRQEGLLSDRHPVWDIANFAAISRKLQNLAEAPRPIDVGENLAQLHQFQELLREILPPVGAPATEADWLSVMRTLLRSDLEQKLSLESLGRRFGFSSEALRKSFTRATGVSPARFRAQARLEAAKVLLLRGDLPHSTIARSLGFKDEGHFSRRFKAMEGLSPRASRAGQK